MKDKEESSMSGWGETSDQSLCRPGSGVRREGRKGTRQEEHGLQCSSESLGKVHWESLN